MNKRIFLIGTLILSACSSMKTKIDKQAVAGVHSVAITGFHMDMQEPKSLVGDFKKAAELMKGNIRDANEEHATADQVYDELVPRLEKLTKMKVKTRAALSADGHYKDLVVKYTKGLQIGGPPIPDSYHRIRPHGILDAGAAIYQMTQEERDALMKELAVDGLVANFVNANLDNESTFGGMIGRAKYKPKTQNVLRLFVKGQKDPVWLDSWGWGEGDKALQAEANYVQDAALLEQIVVSTRRSFDSMAENFRKY